MLNDPVCEEMVRMIRLNPIYLTTKLEGFIIHLLRLNYTTDMEKAMLGAHGICFKDYCRNHALRMKIEKRRDQEHRYCQRMIADLNRKVHS